MKSIFGRLSLTAIALAMCGLLAGAADAKPVSVFPVPGTQVASERTTFSFRGLVPRQLGPVTIVGSQTGRHGSRRLVHSDRRGVSVVPKREFAYGETVTVRTKQQIRGAKKGVFRVRIGRFYGSDDKRGKPGQPPGAPPLKSRPDLRPPPVHVKTTSPQAAPGKYMAAPKQNGMMIFDRFGRVSWFRSAGFAGSGDSIYNFRPQTYRGKPVLTYWKGASSSRGFSQIGTFEILNRRYNRIAKFQPGNGYKADIHEFTITPRNTALVLSYRGVRWDLSRWGGAKDGKLLDNVVQEIDIPTGAVLFEWHSIGNVALGTSASKPPADGTAWDYFHVNSAYPDGGAILISGRRHSTVYRLSRATGRILWRLGGNGNSDFKMGPGTSFGYQHDARRLPNGDISLFDNGSGSGVPLVNADSSVVVLRLHNESKRSRRATLVKRYRHPDGVVSASQGNATPLAKGNFLSGWGSVPQLTEFAPDGTIVFDATVDGPISSYRAYKSPWLGFPADRPAIASARKDGGGATVWASWNGAGNIARWQVLTGPTATKMKPVGSAVWANLETAIQIPRFNKLIRVRALDAKGKMLGQSPAVRIGGSWYPKKDN